MTSDHFLKRRSIIAVVLAIAVGVTAWWLASRNSPAARNPESQAPKVSHYQGPMHPWVKSDKPGKCTVCGMELVPVYAGSEQAGRPATDIVMLPEGASNVANIKTAEVRRRSLGRSLHVAGTIEDDDSKHRILSAF